MLPRGSLENDRGEFSRFALFNVDNIFVPTYANYDPNFLRRRLYLWGGGVSPTPAD
jgi:hypothetical protein